MAYNHFNLDWSDASHALGLTAYDPGHRADFHFREHHAAGRSDPQGGYDPKAIYRDNAMLNETLNKIDGGFFSPADKRRYHDVFNNLVNTATTTCCSPTTPTTSPRRRASMRSTARRPSGSARPSSTSPAWAASPPTAPSAITPTTPAWGLAAQERLTCLANRRLFHSARVSTATRFPSSAVHADSKGKLVLRTLQPGALAVTVIDAESGAPVTQLTQRKIETLGGASGLFEGTLTDRPPDFKYRLRVSWPGAIRRSKTPTASRQCSANSTSGCSPRGRTCVLTSVSARTCARSTA